MSARTFNELFYHKIKGQLVSIELPDRMSYNMLRHAWDAGLCHTCMHPARGLHCQPMLAEELAGMAKRRQAQAAGRVPDKHLWPSGSEVPR